MPRRTTKAVKAAGPKAFVEALVLRNDDAQELSQAAVEAIPGAVGIAEERPLAPTRDFASEILGRVGPATAEIVEKSGGSVRAGDQVGLSGLQARYDDRLGGTPGVVVTAKAGDQERTLLTTAVADGQPLRTTLDERLQKAAEQALDSVGPASALVALRPSTGEILAAASGAGSDGYNTATFGQYPPGSTMKVVTALALMRAGVQPTDRVPCTREIVVDGKTFTNYDDYPASGIGDIPLRSAVANSCNTAMISQREELTGEDLAGAAAALGLGVDHDLGFPAFLGQVPVPASATEQAASLIGQGKVLASPMAMAAVAASVAEGRAVVPRLLPDLPVPEADPAAPLTPEEADALRDMMRAVVTEGTARFLADLPGDPVGAKTGTAEFGTGTPPDTHAWMIATQGDLAVAVFVEEGQSGSQSHPLRPRGLRPLRGHAAPEVDAGGPGAGDRRRDRRASAPARPGRPDPLRHRRRGGRNPVERPFPFMPTLDPADYLADHLETWPTPVIVYRAVGKYAPDELRAWLTAQDPGTGDDGPRRSGLEHRGHAERRSPTPRRCGGTSTRRSSWAASRYPSATAGARMSICACSPSRTPVAGSSSRRSSTTSTQRRTSSPTTTTSAGRATWHGSRPLVFTFSVCGSMKTLDFLRWLGVDVPRWIENDLRHAADPLEASYQQALTTATELIAYCRTLGVPFGINVESVSTASDRPRSEQDPPRIDATGRAPAAGERALVLGGGGSTGNAWLIGVIAGLCGAGLDVTAGRPDHRHVGRLDGRGPDRPARRRTELLAAILAAPSPPATDRPGRTRPCAAVPIMRRRRTTWSRTGAIIAAAEDAADMRRRIGACGTRRRLPIQRRERRPGRRTRAGARVVTLRRQGTDSGGLGHASRHAGRRATHPRQQSRDGLPGHQRRAHVRHQCDGPIAASARSSGLGYDQGRALAERLTGFWR